MDDGSRMCLGLAGGVVCLLVTTFLTACETAVVEVNDSKVKKNAENDKKAKKLLKLISKPTRLMTVSSVARSFLMVAFSAVIMLGFFSSLNKLLLEKFSVNEKETAFLFVSILSIFILSLCIAFVISVFGIIIPKKIVSEKDERAEDFAYNITTIYGILLGVFVPFERIVTFFVAVILKIFGVKNVSEKEAVTEEEILMMVDAVNETGIIEESQKEMINNVFEFNELEVRDVMTHRTSLFAIDINAEISDAVKIVTEEGYSRIPVYEDTVDSIVGVVFAKDLLKIWFKDQDEEKTIRDIMRDIMYVPQTNSCGELFDEFTKTKNQIAVVVDEYGGTAGIVTMEDLIESIVGNIQDEYDDEEEEIDEITPNTFDLLGTAGFEEVMERINITYDGENDYDTIGAFVIDLLGRYPEEDERPSVFYKGIEFSVISTDDKKIERLRALRLKTENGEEI
ncbi:MAG: HlyC/CorC family transporter [Ruminococcus sp.]|nr:HlyC/CorC family transporter [Ruminococcus sp.]